MKIKKLTITEKELSQAVQSYLKTQGVDLPVESVEKEYSYQDYYTVEFVEPKSEPPAPEPCETVTPKTDVEFKPL